MSLLIDLLGPRGAFEGGLFLPDYKAITARRPIEDIKPLIPLQVPLTIRRDLETTPDVAVGDRVLRGRRLSRSVGFDSIGVHAPCSGKVVKFQRVWTATDGYLPGLVLQPDPTQQAVPQRQGWEDESFIVQLAECGVVCACPPAPLHVLVRDAIAAGATDLIINAMETEPYLTADLRTCVEQPGRMIDVTCELADAVGVSRVIFALPFRHRRMVKRILSEAEGRHIEIAPLANPYPQCHPVILTKVLLDREVPPGGHVLDVRACVLPLAAVRQAADALLDDRPVTHTVMTVAGDAVECPGTYRVPIGMPMRHLARSVGLRTPVARAVCGGPLTGRPLGHEDAVVTARTQALLLFSTADRIEPVPCVHCGWCVEDCPVGLDPTEMMNLESRAECAPIEFSRLQACVDCGLCSHVCPSQLPLAETVERTRRRFELRQSSPETSVA